ncbi:hypothetical protein [Halomarina oriensis]|uniref:Uncharacterized protein n=1 Tax=Halomarina oriensis TaxID=671145 RepID=A0A6B0GLV6_9EURY|nr:hypothetical protein [Halomarina oriensis]MWG33115.1 hypothetical protein [Halomarina oriensis]
MTFDHIHREEAPNIGEPETIDTAELHGVAPPCVECGETEQVNDDRCDDCFDWEEEERLRAEAEVELEGR